MPLVVSNLEIASLGNLIAATGTAAFDSNYPTGGEALTPNQLGMTTIRYVHFEPTAGLVFEYDHTNQKVLVYAQGVLVGAAGAVVIDDFPVTAGPGVSASVSIGLGAGGATVGLGALKEVPSTNDLSTITGVNFFAVGT